MSEERPPGASFRSAGPEWSDEPEFGERFADRDYPPRPGAYAVLWDRERRRLGVIRTRDGWFLPGGGIEAGESARDALAREIAEECALEIDEVRGLGRAVENAFVRGEDRCFRKECEFFEARAGERRGVPIEDDHELHWLAPEEALARLTHASQVWVVRRVASGAAERG